MATPVNVHSFRILVVVHRDVGADGVRIFSPRRLVAIVPTSSEVRANAVDVFNEVNFAGFSNVMLIRILWWVHPKRKPHPRLQPIRRTVSRGLQVNLDMRILVEIDRRMRISINTAAAGGGVGTDSNVVPICLNNTASLDDPSVASAMAASLGPRKLQIGVPRRGRWTGRCRCRR